MIRHGDRAGGSITSARDTTPEKVAPGGGIINPREAYDELIARARVQSLLGSCSAVLSWDEQTYMPVGGALHRGAQMALLAGLRHERATDPRVGELLAVVEGSDLVADPGSVAGVNVRELRRSRDRLMRHAANAG